MDNFHSPEDILTSSIFSKETCLKRKNLGVKSQADFTVLLQHSPGGRLTRHRNSRHPERDLNSRRSGCEARFFPLDRYAGSWTGDAWIADPKGSPLNHSPSTDWPHCTKANVDCYRTIFSTRCQPAAHLRSASTATIHELAFIKMHCVKNK